MDEMILKMDKLIASLESSAFSNS